MKLNGSLQHCHLNVIYAPILRDVSFNWLEIDEQRLFHLSDRPFNFRDWGENMLFRKGIMSFIQGFIILMGLGGQVLVASKDRRGYLAWIAGSFALMIVYYETDQFALGLFQIANTVIQSIAFYSWSSTKNVAN